MVPHVQACDGGFCTAGGTLLQCAQELFATCSNAAEVAGLELLNSCGGHAEPYHYHEDLICHYNENTGSHSTAVGVALDGRVIYGRFEGAPAVCLCHYHEHVMAVSAAATLKVQFL